MITSDTTKQYEDFLQHRHRLLLDVVADDFKYVMGKLKNSVTEFVEKNPEFKKQANKDFHLDL